MKDRGGLREVKIRIQYTRAYIEKRERARGDSAVASIRDHTLLQVLLV